MTTTSKREYPTSHEPKDLARWIIVLGVPATICGRVRDLDPLEAEPDPEVEINRFERQLASHDPQILDLAFEVVHVRNINFDQRGPGQFVAVGQVDHQQAFTPAQLCQGFPLRMVLRDRPVIVVSELEETDRVTVLTLIKQAAKYRDAVRVARSPIKLGPVQ